MIQLVRNCSHGNEVVVCIEDGGLFGKRIIKSASTANGIESLKSECEGYAWYQVKRYPNRSDPICKIIQQNSHFMMIEIEFIEGRVGDCYQELHKNREFINKVIEHYCSVWQCLPDGLAPFHGDYSLGNAIYNKDGIHVIDWEHFNLTGVPWGFDVLHLLFNNLKLSMKNRYLPKHQEIEILAESINTLNECNKLKNDMICNPLAYLIDFIGQNGALWGTSTNKLPVLFFNKDQVKQIDNMFCLANKYV